MADHLENALRKLSKYHAAEDWVKELCFDNNQVDASLLPVEILALVHDGYYVDPFWIEEALKMKREGDCQPFNVWVGPFSWVERDTRRFING